MRLCLAMRFVLMAVLAAATIPIVADEGDNSQPVVTVAVKQLDRPAPATESSDAMPAMRLAPVPPPVTLPAERLPQYRIGYQRSDATLQSQVAEGTFRFILTDPTVLDQVGRPLLLEAIILIDGVPFSSVRDQTAAAHLTASTEPPTLAPEPSGPRQGESSDAAVDAADAGTEKPKTEIKTGDDNGGEDAPAGANDLAYRPTSDPAELLRRYAEAVGEPLDQTEAGWLMTHWTEGPTLLVLNPYYQSFRADQRPAFTVLDRNRDGLLSEAEMDDVDDSLRRCDANRDDVVDVLEIAQTADGLRESTVTFEAAGPLFWLLSDLVGVSVQDSHLYQSVAKFDSNQNGRIEAAEIDQLAEQTPDIRMTVAFVSDAAESSKLHVSGVNQELSANVEQNRQGDGIDVSIGGLSIHLSAIQATFLPRRSGQIAVGAVVDGYPLLPELDPNDDGRLTIRERRVLAKRLRAKDRDNDNALSRQECLSPIRVCIGFGPIVHQELAGVRMVPPIAATESISGPEWFVRMDRNQDNDLTRGEFPGTDEQFVALDTDGDSLVSAAEANDFETQSGK